MLQILKLKNGEEILSDVEESGDMLVLKKPVKVGIQQQNGIQPPADAVNDIDKLLDYVHIIFSPWSVLSGDKITISSNDVLFRDEPRLQIRNAYNETLGSGITIARSGLIKG